MKKTFGLIALLAAALLFSVNSFAYTYTLDFTVPDKPSFSDDMQELMHAMKNNVGSLDFCIFEDADGENVVDFTSELNATLYPKWKQVPNYNHPERIQIADDWQIGQPASEYNPLVSGTFMTFVSDFKLKLTDMKIGNYAGEQDIDLGVKYNFTPAPVPVPAAVWLLGSGLIGLAGFARKKRQ